MKQKNQLITWLRDNTTGNERMRAGVPAGWLVGDKTGTGDYGTTNDIAVIWPAKNASPVVLVIYFTQPKKDVSPLNTVIVNVTKMVISALTTSSIIPNS